MIITEIATEPISCSICLRLSVKTIEIQCSEVSALNTVRHPSGFQARFQGISFLI